MRTEDRTGCGRIVPRALPQAAEDDASPSKLSIEQLRTAESKWRISTVTFAGERAGVLAWIEAMVRIAVSLVRSPSRIRRCSPSKDCAADTHVLPYPSCWVCLVGRVLLGIVALQWSDRSASRRVSSFRPTLLGASWKTSTLTCPNLSLQNLYHPCASGPTKDQRFRPALAARRRNPSDLVMGC